MWIYVDMKTVTQIYINWHTCICLRVWECAWICFCEIFSCWLYHHSTAKCTHRDFSTISFHFFSNFLPLFFLLCFKLSLLVGNYNGIFFFLFFFVAFDSLMSHILDASTIHRPRVQVFCLSESAWSACEWSSSSLSEWRCIRVCVCMPVCVCINGT